MLSDFSARWTARAISAWTSNDNRAERQQETCGTTAGDKPGIKQHVARDVHGILKVALDCGKG
jgi:hypothetical protein